MDDPTKYFELPYHTESKTNSGKIQYSVRSVLGRQVLHLTDGELSFDVDGVIVEYQKYSGTVWT